MRTRRTIFATTLALAAIAHATPAATTTSATTLPANATVEVFDPALFPLHRDRDALTVEQRAGILRDRNASEENKVAERRDRAATTLPIDAVATVARLADRDPAERWAARSALMSLDAAALPLLRDALGDVTLSRAQASVLRDAVVQVTLADRHRFGGAPPAAMGISLWSAADDVPIVGARMLGWDGYRAFQEGDAIVGIRLPAGRTATVGGMTATAAAMVAVRTRGDLLAALFGTRPGDRVLVRVLRNGVSVEVEVRVAVKLDDQTDTLMRNRFAAEADKYWQTQFAPRLRVAAPTTRAVQ